MNGNTNNLLVSVQPLIVVSSQPRQDTVRRSVTGRTHFDIGYDN